MNKVAFALTAIIIILSKNVFTLAGILNRFRSGRMGSPLISIPTRTASVLRPAVCIVLVAISILAASSAHAGWIIYHQSELKGAVLDIDSKQPVEGAVIVAVYWKTSLGFGAGGTDSIINVREVLTNKEGQFRFAPYTTLIQPFSWQIPTTLIIFKPGYASVNLGSYHFAGEELKKEQTMGWPWTDELKYKLRGRGIVEIPKIKTKKELEKRMLGFPTDYGAKKLPLLYKAYEEEKKDSGMLNEEK